MAGIVTPTSPRRLWWQLRRLERTVVPDRVANEGTGDQTLGVTNNFQSSRPEWAAAELQGHPPRAMSEDEDMTRDVGSTVTISPPSEADCAQFIARVGQSRSLHGSWVSPPADEGEFATYLQRVRRMDHQGFLIRAS